MAEEKMNFSLSTITNFDDMKSKRFTLKKCNYISPRIAALQKSLGFAPGEPLNAKNFHRIIPAAKDINLILNKRRKSMMPVQKIQPRQISATPQNRLSTSFRPGSSRMSDVRTPNTTNGINGRFLTPASMKSSIKKVSSSHDIVGAILQRASSTNLSSRFSTPNTTKSSIAKDEVYSTKNPDEHPISSQESGVSVSTEDSETCTEEENAISDLVF